MTDRELMQMALYALTSHRITANERNNILKALRERLSQPEREWVGLTEENIYDAMDNEDEFDFAKAIEAKLKEKNT